MSKICIFASHYLPYLGGIERYTYNLAKALQKSGDEVLIVTNNDMRLKNTETMDGIKVLRFPCYNFMKGRYPVVKYNRKFRELYDRLKKQEFDLVLINARFYPHTLVGAWFARRKKIRCIILDHGTSHMTVGKKLPDFLFAAVEHGLTLCDRLLCKEYFGVSKACCHWLQHFKIQAEGVLYNAVDAKKIEELAEHPVRDYRREYGLSKDTLAIVYTGRLIKEKGIFKLIQAVKSMEKKYDVVLFVAGDGEEAGAVRQMEDDRIKVLGRLEFPQIAALLGQAQIYCLPTEYPEGFPTSVLEAAAAGCYVITTDRGGSKELIENEAYGTILKTVTVESIKSALEKLADAPEERTMAAKRAKEIVDQRYTWDMTAGKVHALAEEGKKDGNKKAGYHPGL